MSNHNVPPVKWTNNTPTRVEHYSQNRIIIYIYILFHVTLKSKCIKMDVKMESVEIWFLKTLLTAHVLTCATTKSIGLNLYNPVSVVVPPHSKILVDMGITFQIPLGYYGCIAPRSGLALHHHIHIGTGVIDPNYMVAVQVLLLNFGSKSQVIKGNTRIAQIILEKVAYLILCEVP